MPKVRQILAGASFDPAALTQLQKLYDKVWARLEPEYRDDRGAARTRLAQIMVKLAGDQQLSAQEIIQTALRLMREG
jgi:hypothetical protein